MLIIFLGLRVSAELKRSENLYMVITSKLDKRVRINADPIYFVQALVKKILDYVTIVT